MPPRKKQTPGDILHGLVNAVRKEGVSSVRRWLDKGADLEGRMPGSGDTPLHWAAWGGDLDVLEFLDGLGVNWNVQSNDGSTPLHFVMATDNEAAILFLVRHGADVTVTDNRGNTPLDSPQSRADMAQLVRHEISRRHARKMQAARRFARRRGP